jgi:hypothetical protein
MDADAPNSVRAHTLKPERERELLDEWHDRVRVVS